MVEDSDLPDRLEEADLPAVLGLVLTRAAEGGATVILRDGQPIAAVMSMNDFEAAEAEVDRRFEARTYPPDDGTRYSLEELLAEHAEDGE
ncbi:prevent-host-death protein [Streptomyces sp. NBC_01803]|uniref:prevent-host-death protein n=1 Tax=Streptomyces sp. NBC_01803 TaxID=2975946 RepID=UPI002DD92A3F|nr:prevent-host-death protein [Streptomyces sp. NBC_01803]WSA44554.1 prevent-host-death protein [Streptomyces sp. NBC_01803]